MNSLKNIHKKESKMSPRTDNLRVTSFERVVSAKTLKKILPLSEEDSQFIADSRLEISKILSKESNKFLVVVGPCSIHDVNAAKEYARRLSELRKKMSDVVELVVRVYGEKPRTRIGWKGFIADPEMDSSHDMNKGLEAIRKLMLYMTSLRLPIAVEILNTITPQYFADLVSYGAIGARTSESQIHREVVSGLSFPVGIKNGTDGSIEIAVDAIVAANHPQAFIGIDLDSTTSIVKTTGNQNAHLILRGGSKGTNYDRESISNATKQLDMAKISKAVVVDCSHGNSMKKSANQHCVLEEVRDLFVEDEMNISGVMLESYLEGGRQHFIYEVEQKASLNPNLSVTDECIGWDETEQLLLETAEVLRENQTSESKIQASA